MKHVAVIGGGIAGSATALRAAQNGLDTVWFLGDKRTRKRSRSQWVANIDNMIGLHDDIVKNQVLAVLRKNKFHEAAESLAGQHFHINNRMIIQNTIDRIRADYPAVDIISESVTDLNLSDGVFTLSSVGTEKKAESVVLCTGVMDEQPVILKPDRTGAPLASEKWIYPFANREQVLYCIRCEGHLTKQDAVAVLGNSNTAAELAMMLHERYGIRVVILGNGLPLGISSKRRHILQAYEIEIVPDQITNIISDGVKQLRGFTFDRHEDVMVRFALVSLGLYRVYNDLAIKVGTELADEQEAVEKRHIYIDHKGETSVRGFFVVGDATKRRTEPVMKQIYTAQEYAIRAVDTIDSRRRKRLREEL